MRSPLGGQRGRDPWRRLLKNPAGKQGADATDPNQAANGANSLKTLIHIRIHQPRPAKISIRLGRLIALSYGASHRFPYRVKHIILHRHKPARGCYRRCALLGVCIGSQREVAAQTVLRPPAKNCQKVANFLEITCISPHLNASDCILQWVEYQLVN